jgi:hypothetical protein
MFLFTIDHGHTAYQTKPVLTIVWQQLEHCWKIFAGLICTFQFTIGQTIICTTSPRIQKSFNMWPGHLFAYAMALLWIMYAELSSKWIICSLLLWILAFSNYMFLFTIDNGHTAYHAIALLHFRFDLSIHCITIACSKLTYIFKESAALCLLKIIAKVIFYPWIALTVI